MRRAERKVTVRLIESDSVHNYRLIAESIAKQIINERGLKHD